MLGDCKPNDFGYASVLSVCDHRRGVQVHGVTVKSGFDSWVYVGNALVTMYANGGYCDEAWRVFSAMEFKNVVSYNAMIEGYRICGRGDEGVGIFAMMYNDGNIGFDHASILSVISSVCEYDESDCFQGLRYCYQLHSVCLKSGLLSDMAVVTALMKAYSGLGVEVLQCYKLFVEAGDKQRDIILWTGIMTAFSEKDPDGTIFLFRELKRGGGVPDCYAFTVVLKACAGLVTDSHALSVHCQAIKSAVIDLVVLGNALIHAYARSGSMSSAKQIFNEMVSRDVVSWNTMLKAYALHGQSKEALELFDRMDVEPDATTFVAMLSACSHTGMVGEGKRIFSTMLQKYGVAPKLDHYACMVDILGRAGHVREAEKLIREMPIEPDYVVWGALLAACRKHGETQLASVAVSKLKELDPDNSLGYITLSNLYCSAGSFCEADLIRKKMGSLGIRKEPGLSWTKIGQQVHEFASGGRQHSQGEAIRAYTKGFVAKLKELGYNPDTSLPSQDVEDEHKEEQLYYHSEKLALVFTLMNAPNKSDCSTGVTKIMKNIRSCLDCHNFMKYASALVQKEIIVRDSNRFHHFKEGSCSCNDYW
ncbi:hypothetical protein Leryth_004933 [Lithospermum erythrorhizon]|nr:hypothetical protein Leryth_004933 [Lithospermum erythrorhizon]